MCQIHQNYTYDSTLGRGERAERMEFDMICHIMFALFIVFVLFHGLTLLHGQLSFADTHIDMMSSIPENSRAKQNRRDHDDDEEEYSNTVDDIFILMKMYVQCSSAPLRRLFLARSVPFPNCNILSLSYVALRRGTL